MALGRDVAVVAAVGGAFLLAGAGVGGWIIGSSQADASGAEARGYEQGKESGQKAGFAAGKREGLEQGRAAGVKTGRAQGRKTGFAAGRNKGEEEGRASGYASGYAEGRSTALGGLAVRRLVRAADRLGRERAGRRGRDAGGPGVLLRAQRRLGDERPLLTAGAAAAARAAAAPRTGIGTRGERRSRPAAPLRPPAARS